MTATLSTTPSGKPIVTLSNGEFHEFESEAAAQVFVHSINGGVSQSVNEGRWDKREVAV